MIDPMSDLMPVEGENVMLQCKVSGSPLPQVAWYKNGQRHADRQVSYKRKQIKQLK